MILPATQVSVSSSYGSGTVIYHGGEVFVLTAHHVIETALAPRKQTYFDELGKVVEVEVKAPLPVTITNKCEKGNETTRVGDIVWSSQGPDLALVRPRCPKGLVSARIASRGTLSAGEACWYCGHGGGLPWSLQLSIINRPLYRGYTYVNGGAWFGHSGSGLFVRRANDNSGSRNRHDLVGVVVMIHSLDNPRAAALCETHASITTFLKAYTEHSSKLKPKAKLP